MSEPPRRVTGLGGVFFKAADPEGNKLELWEPIEAKYEELLETEPGTVTET